MKDNINKTTYDKSAIALVNKYNKLCARTNDIMIGLSFLKIKNPIVLEIGCGSGRDAKEILNYTKNYLGVDISKNMIKLARKENPNANFYVTDITTFNFPKKIDIVFAFASLLHCNKKEMKKVLYSIYKSLSTNGIIYLSLKYGNYKKEIKNDEYGKRIFYTYTFRDIRNLSKNKFKIVKYNKQFFQNQDWFTIILKKNE